MELKEIMKNAGIVGAGGAGFPSYAKLADGADTLVINGAECEPLLYTDYIIMKNEMHTVLDGISAILGYANIPRALLCVKEHTAERLDIADGTKLADKITLKVLPNVYPMGDEVSLIYQATGRVVRPGSLPITSHVIVYNVETMYNVAKAINGEVLTMKWLTIGGDVKRPIVVRVPVGTSVAALFTKYGFTVDENHRLLDGGPSMGRITDPATAVITKTTKGLLILPENSEAVASKRISGDKAAARAETACCQCTRCTDMCPRANLGYPLEPHKMVRTAVHAAEISPELVISATLCCGCGICETLACCQGISPKAVINGYKAILGRNRMRFSTNTDVTVSPEREYRMVPSDRWERVLEVDKYDRVADYVGEDRDFASVTVMLSQHIGAPSVCKVNVGDTVRAGDRIADGADGLSLPQYASIDGKVTAVDAKKITIGRV